jgi:hypothetical protein
MWLQQELPHSLSFCGKSAAYPFVGRAAITYLSYLSSLWEGWHALAELILLWEELG